MDWYSIEDGRIYYRNHNDTVDGSHTGMITPESDNLDTSIDLIINILGLEDILLGEIS